MSSEHNFNVISGDTDSILFCKPDQSPFSKEERTALLEEMNSKFPEKINWSDDGYFDCVIILKAKNYILYDGKKIKYKGSSLKSSKMEPATKDFQQEIIHAIINNTGNYQDIYHKYIKEALNITDIKRWSSRKTYTKALDESDRKNETNIKDAIEGSSYVEGDKFLVFFETDEKLCLVENYTGAYCKERMLEKVYKAAQVFANVLDTKTLFIKYHLKTKKKELDQLAIS